MYFYIMSEQNCLDPLQSYQSKQGCKDQESRQSSTTPDPEYQWSTFNFKCVDDVPLLVVFGSSILSSTKKQGSGSAHVKHCRHYKKSQYIVQSQSRLTLYALMNSSILFDTVSLERSRDHRLRFPN